MGRAGLLIANKPVVGQQPCLRFVYCYFKNSQMERKILKVSYGKDGGRLTLLQARKKLLEFKEWRK